jgi:hypothetical protein
LTIYTYHDNFLHFLPISHLTRFSCPQVFVHSKYLWIHFCILPFFLLWSDATFSTLLWIYLVVGRPTHKLIFLFLFCFVLLFWLVTSQLEFKMILQRVWNQWVSFLMDW